MTTLLQGCVSISHEEIIKKLGLTPDSILQVKNEGREITINVVASEANQKDWLVSNESQHWIIPKIKLDLN